MTDGLVVNAPAVVAELFEEEVVAIHLDRGTYYSLSGGAPRLWPLIGCGLGAAAIAERIAAPLPPGEAAAARAAVLAFLAELEAEELVRIGPGAGEPPALAAGEGFEPPRLERFTDMQELIALDPVHDVTDAEGWPVKPPLTPKAG